MLFDDIKQKIILYKQKKIIDLINFVMDKDNISVYYNARKIISNHRIFIDMYGTNKLLFFIRKYHINVLSLKKQKNKNTVNDKEVLRSENIVEILSDSFIERYEKIISSVNYIEKNIEYLTHEQKVRLLKEYNFVYNNLEYNRTLVRNVK